MSFSSLFFSFAIGVDLSLSDSVATVFLSSQYYISFNNAWQNPYLFHTYSSSKSSRRFDETQLN